MKSLIEKLTIATTTGVLFLEALGGMAFYKSQPLKEFYRNLSISVADSGFFKPEINYGAIRANRRSKQEGQIYSLETTQKEEDK